MSVSVVVPTRDRPRALAACLAALAAQDLEALEVVVVDDRSRDRAAVTAVAAEAGCGARVLRAPGRGPAAARNLGARFAAGEVICFTDDDCVPAPGWATALASAAREAEAAAGRTVVPARAGAAAVATQTIVEHLMLSSLGPGDRRLAFAPSCNLALTREAIERLPFDESYPTAAGEDRDWSDRAAGAGSGPVWVPDACVVHRGTLGAAGFARRQYRYGRGAARYRAGDARRRVASPRFYGGLVRRGFDHGLAVGSLVVAAQALTAAGVAAERLGPLRSGN